MSAVSNAFFTVLLSAALGALIPEVSGHGAGSGNALDDFVLVSAVSFAFFAVHLVAPLGALVPDVSGHGAGSGFALDDFIVVVADIQLAAQQALAVVESVIVVGGQGFFGNGFTAILADNLAVTFLGAVSLENVGVGLCVLASFGLATQQTGAFIECMVVVGGQSLGAQQGITILTVGVAITFEFTSRLIGAGVGVTREMLALIVGTSIKVNVVCGDFLGPGTTTDPPENAVLSCLAGGCASGGGSLKPRGIPVMIKQSVMIPAVLISGSQNSGRDHADGNCQNHQQCQNSFLHFGYFPPYLYRFF